MKYLFDNLMPLVLALVLGLSPLQNVTASVSKCMNKSMNGGIHHVMKNSDKVMQSDMAKSDTQHDCCNKNECGTTHCASSAMTAVMTSVTTSDIAYTVGTIYSKPPLSLISFYPSSLYRPPKI